MRFLIFIFWTFISTPIMAGYTGPTQESTVQDSVVRSAKKVKKETTVELVGQLIQGLGNSEYQFQDKSGKIIVIISDDLLNDLEINENDIVQITGQSVRDKKRFKVQVESITKQPTVVEDSEFQF